MIKRGRVVPKRRPLSSLSFLSSVVSVVPKLCLGMRPREALLRLSDSLSDSGLNLWDWIRQAELGMTHSQAELGNDRNRREYSPCSPASTSGLRRIGESGLPVGNSAHVRQIVGDSLVAINASALRSPQIFVVKPRRARGLRA